MVSFAELWEQLEKHKSVSPLMTSGEDDRALNVVRSGRDLRGEDDPSFWDDFISLCGNSDGMAELLGVSREKISGWPAKIQEMLEKLERHNAEHPDEDEEKEVMPTGDTGAFTTNQDPTDLGAMS